MPRDKLERIEARIATLVPSYLERRLDDVDELRAAQAAGDRDRIAAIAHNLKGTGASYGYAWISEIGAHLERAAEQDLSGVEALVRRLRERIVFERGILATHHRRR